MIILLSLPLTALNGTVLAASVWEYVNTSTWQPSTSCAPACSGNTGFAAARLSDQSVIVSSPPLQGECTKPAYSCMMDYLAFFPEP